MKTSPENNECPRRHSFCENLLQCLGEIWRDLQAHSAWKYEDFPPSQLLEKSEVHRYPIHQDELLRADWFWSRRPRRLSAVCWVLWFVVALGLPLWLFVVPWIGVPLLTIAVVIAQPGGCADCPLAPSVRIKYRSTHSHFRQRQEYSRRGCFQLTRVPENFNRPFRYAEI
jgi:hypothetical protein